MCFSFTPGRKWRVNREGKWRRLHTQVRTAPANKPSKQSGRLKHWALLLILPYQGRLVSAAAAAPVTWLLPDYNRTGPHSSLLLFEITSAQQVNTSQQKPFVQVFHLSTKKKKTKTDKIKANLWKNCPLGTMFFNLLLKLLSYLL